MTRKHIFSLVEIGVVILSGFIASYVMKRNDIHFFALPHLVFLFTAVVFRSVLSNWKLADYGFHGSIFYQIKLGILIWLIVQSYYSILHVFAPLFPEFSKVGAIVFKITTPDDLKNKIIEIALFKAGIVETLRYFSYAQGLLMQTFGVTIGAFMTFVFFGSAHIGIMSLIVLPVSFLFVYFYRSYRLIIPVIIFHALGDTGGFIQNYLTYKELYFFNYLIFAVLIMGIIRFRGDIMEIVRNIVEGVTHDFMWVKSNKMKTVAVSVILPAWLHLLLFYGV